MENTDKEILQIDIRKTFAQKSPKLAKFIPGFVFRWLSKMLHVDEINEVLIEGAELQGSAFVKYCMNKLGATVTAVGLEHIPKTGGVIMASNHPLGGVDGMSLILVTQPVRPDVKFIVNDILMVFPNFDDIFIPVNKVGSSARASLQRVEEIYAGDEAILIFPAGLCSRKINGKIVDLEWNRSFINRAVKFKKPLIPTFISGKNTNRFYNLANFRKWLGIKANIEMFFLPDEMFKQQGKKIDILFGKPIPHSVFDQRKTAQQWANLLHDFIYVLPENPQADFEEFIKPHL